MATTNVLLTLAILLTTLLSPAAGQSYGLAGIGFNSSSTVLGNAYNYWRRLPNGTYDLTRSDVMPVTTPKLIPFSGTRRPSAIIEPSRTVLAIVDMQNYL